MDRWARFFALALRNPLRNSFDRQTGKLWLADVGQGARAEINFIAASAVTDRWPELRLARARRRHRHAGRGRRA